MEIVQGTPVRAPTVAERTQATILKQLRAGEWRPESQGEVTIPYLRGTELKPGMTPAMLVEALETYLDTID